MKIATIIIVVLATSCTKDQDAGLRLQASRWTPEERSSLAAMPEVNRPSTNDVIWRANSTAGGVTQSICLQDRPFGTFHSSYALCVFDAAGQILEYNRIRVPDQVIPTRIVSMNPVTVEFTDPKRRERGSFVRAPDKTSAEFIQSCKEAGPRVEEMKRLATEQRGQHHPAPYPEPLTVQER